MVFHRQPQGPPYVFEAESLDEPTQSSHTDQADWPGKPLAPPVLGSPLRLQVCSVVLGFHAVDRDENSGPHIGWQTLYHVSHLSNSSF